MVTTNSLTQDLTFLVSDLLGSDFGEDEDVAQKAGETLAKLVEKLRPIIHYIAVYTRLSDGRSGKFVVVMQGEGSVPALVLDQDCQWGNLFWDTDKEKAEFRENKYAWQNYVFGSIIESLKYTLEKAEAKRKEHLEAVTKRRQMLDDIMKIIKGTK